jgi:hypothetical protein
MFQSARISQYLRRYIIFKFCGLHCILVLLAGLRGTFYTAAARLLFCSSTASQCAMFCFLAWHHVLSCLFKHHSISLFSWPFVVPQTFTNNHCTSPPPIDYFILNLLLLGKKNSIILWWRDIGKQESNYHEEQK